MGRTGWALGFAAMFALGGWVPAIAVQIAGTDFGGSQASADTRYVARWILESADHHGLPFAIVDKRDARIYVFERDGRLSGVSAALLGQTRGDDIAPDVGKHTQAGKVPLRERTTPAGRFDSAPGRNLDGEHVVWVDFASALAIHRVRPGASRRAREARLASASPRDNRASLGCVVVARNFYSKVVEPLLGRSRAVIYVLPEQRPVREIFNAL